MDNVTGFYSEQPGHEPTEGANKTDQDASTAENAIDTFPPKFERSKNIVNVWLKSLMTLALYLIIGFYIFKKWELLLLITAIVIFHELGHYTAMRIFRYKDLTIFFLPLIGAYVSGKKREVSQKESAIILLAGPLPGIVLGICFYLLWQYYPQFNIAGISFYYIALLLIVLNLINLLPIYPLDGGQLLNRIFFNEENWLSKSFVILSIVFMFWFAWKSKFPVFFIIPVMMTLRLFQEKNYGHIEKQIEKEGINTDLEYEELPDKDYWKIRKIIIEHDSYFKDIALSPPFEYSEKEDKIMTVIQSLLHRHLIQDISVSGKIMVFLIWAATLASPWLIKMDISFLFR
jgi:Zn-dependent protease